MKQTVSLNDFEKAFEWANRIDNFSYDGLRAMFEYLEQYEEDCDTEIELDVIAICCEFTEYDNLKEFQDNYGDEYQSIDDIYNETMVIPIDDESFIIQNF